MAEVGSEVVLQAEFRNRLGVRTNPTVLAGYMKRPTTNILRNLNFVEVEVGLYEASYLITEPGEHTWRVEATGAITATGEKTFNVPVPKVTVP